MSRVRLSTLAVALLATLIATPSPAATVAMVAPASLPTTCFGSTSGTQYNPSPGATVQVDTRDQQSAFNCGYVMANAANASLAAAATQSKSLFALISHSYTDNTIPKAAIVSASVSGNTATVVLQSNATLSVGQMVRVYGMNALGYPNWDGYFALTAANNSTFTYSWTNGALANASSFNLPNGQVYLYNFDANLGTGGYLSAGWLAWARVFTYDGFWLPPSYCYGASGGGIVPLFSTDPGAVAMATYVAARNPKPKYVVYDLGINDANSGVSLANAQAAMVAAAAITRQSGSTPILIAIRPTALGLSVAKWSKAWNSWIQSNSNAGKWIVVDTTKMLSDPTSTTGAGLAGLFTDNVHINATGAISDGHYFANLLGGPAAGSTVSGSSGPLIPYGNTVINSAADVFDSTYNLTGTIAPLVSSIPAGLFSGTVAGVTLTGSAQAVGNIFASEFGAGTSVVTASIAARTDTTPDGTVFPGSELVLSYAAGTGPKTAYITLTAGGTIGTGASTYNPGDTLQAQVEYEVDPSSITAGVSYTTHNIQLFENASSGPQIGVNVFSTAGALDTGHAAYAASKGILVTPVFLTRSTSQTVGLAVQVGFTSGTLTTPYVIRIRGISLRKIDPQYGEPF